MEPGAPSLAPARGLARDRELVRAALQKIENRSRRHRQAAGATRRATNVALPPNARSESAQDRCDVFGNNRARPARLDERRRNYFPDRIDGPGGQAQRLRAEIEAIAPPTL